MRPRYIIGSRFCLIHRALEAGQVSKRRSTKNARGLLKPSETMSVDVLCSRHACMFVRRGHAIKKDKENLDVRRCRMLYLNFTTSLVLRPSKPSRTASR